jgi:Big-like domain-containing protein/cellulose binding protein with CBM2 domain
MARLLFPRSSFALGLTLVLTLVLVACSGDPEDSMNEAVASVAVAGGGVTVDVVTTNVWNGGFNGAVRITDTAFNGPITSFQIVFKLGGSPVVGSAWNGPISGPDASGNYTATNPDWLPFNPIQRGQIWDVGFNASGTFSGSTIVSVTINGQTIPIGGDPTPPVVSLVSSATTVTVAGNITLTATATDNVGVVRVEFFDGTTLLGTDTVSPYTQVLGLTAANNGTHSYTARAFDAAGTVGISAAVTVTVNIILGGTPPTVSLTSSATAVTAAGSITLTVNPGPGVVRVEFFDGSRLLAVATAPPFSVTVALTAADNSIHCYRATGFDAAGNSGISAPLCIPVDIESLPVPGGQ